MEHSEEKLNKNLYKTLREILSGTAPEHDTAIKIVNLIYSHTEQVPLDRQEYDRDEKRILEAVDHIKKHLDNLPSIKEFARMVGINEKKLQLKFKRLFGKTFDKFFDFIKMEKAREYLCHTDMPHTEIAERLGFESSSGFYRAIRRIYGCTPNTLRKRGNSKRNP